MIHSWVERGNFIFQVEVEQKETGSPRRWGSSPSPGSHPSPRKATAAEGYRGEAQTPCSKYALLLTDAGTTSLRSSLSDSDLEAKYRSMGQRGSKSPLREIEQHSGSQRAEGTAGPGARVIVG
jgi:hypothetical protein